MTGGLEAWQRTGRGDAGPGNRTPQLAYDAATFAFVHLAGGTTASNTSNMRGSAYLDPAEVCIQRLVFMCLVKERGESSVCCLVPLSLIFLSLLLTVLRSLLLPHSSA